MNNIRKSLEIKCTKWAYNSTFHQFPITKITAPLFFNATEHRNVEWLKMIGLACRKAEYFHLLLGFLKEFLAVPYEQLVVDVTEVPIDKNNCLKITINNINEKYNL